MGETKVAQDHSLLREKLQSKSYMIIDEFSCKGFNTNSFLKLFGGMNKGRPNAKDFKDAEEFAQNLKRNLQKKWNKTLGFTNFILVKYIENDRIKASLEEYL